MEASLERWPLLQRPAPPYWRWSCTWEHGEGHVSSPAAEPRKHHRRVIICFHLMVSSAEGEGPAAGTQSDDPGPSAVPSPRDGASRPGRHISRPESPAPLPSDHDRAAERASRSAPAPVPFVVLADDEEEEEEEEEEAEGGPRRPAAHGAHGGDLPASQGAPGGSQPGPEGPPLPSGRLQNLLRRQQGVADRGPFGHVGATSGLAGVWADVAEGPVRREGAGAEGSFEEREEKEGGEENAEYKGGTRQAAPEGQGHRARAAAHLRGFKVRLGGQDGEEETDNESSEREGDGRRGGGSGSGSENDDDLQFLGENGPPTAAAGPFKEQAAARQGFRMAAPQGEEDEEEGPDLPGASSRPAPQVNGLHAAGWPARAPAPVPRAPPAGGGAAGDGAAQGAWDDVLWAANRERGGGGGGRRAAAARGTRFSAPADDSDEARGASSSGGASTSASDVEMVDSSAWEQARMQRELQGGARRRRGAAGGAGQRETHSPPAAAEEVRVKQNPPFYTRAGGGGPRLRPRPRHRPNGVKVGAHFDAASGAGVQTGGPGGGGSWQGADGHVPKGKPPDKGKQHQQAASGGRPSGSPRAAAAAGGAAGARGEGARTERAADKEEHRHVAPRGGGTAPHAVPPNRADAGGGAPGQPPPPPPQPPDATAGVSSPRAAGVAESANGSEARSAGAAGELPGSPAAAAGRQETAGKAASGGSGSGDHKGVVAALRNGESSGAAAFPPGHEAGPMTAGGGDADVAPQGHEWDREAVKGSQEFQSADKAEWEQRNMVVQREREEAQKAKKRKRAEMERKREMAARQRQRVGELRAAQIKEASASGLKEGMKEQIRADLETRTAGCRDLATVLRRLGIAVGGGERPTVDDVKAAYKKALLRFHPDRVAPAAVAAGDSRRQVEAEETFKLISRLKAALPLVVAPPPSSHAFQFGSSRYYY